MSNYLPLGKCCVFIRNGYSIKQDSRSGGLPITRIETIAKGYIDSEKVGFAGINDPSSYSEHLLKDGDILVSHINSVSHLGKAAIYEGNPKQLIHGMNLLCMRPNTRLVDPKYLFYFTKSTMFKSQLPKITNNSVNQASFSSSNFKEKIQVPVPSIDIQKNITSILSKAEHLNLKRKQSLSLLDQYLETIFVEMFGDPVENPNDMDVIKFGTIIENICYGSSRKSMIDQDNDSLPILRIPNIIGGKINYKNLQFQSLPINEKNKLTLKKGDILFVRSNGNPDYIGRCAVFDDNKEFIFASYLIRVRLKQNSGFDPLFIRYCFSIGSYKSKIRKESRTTAGNYNINTQGIKNFDLIKPPVKQQEKFMEMFLQVEALKKKMLSQSEELEIQFQSLMQRSFSSTN